MNSMMKDASGYVGVVCPKVAAMKNERTLKIFCEAAARDKDSWPCTIFATESTLPIVLDACDCNRLVVVAPHNRNADFTFGMWRLAETNSFTPRSENESGFDIMIYEPTGDLMISESELDAELERLCREMDSDVFDPPSKEDEEAIAKVLDFVKGGLVVDNSHLDGFDNDYEDVIGMEEIMKDRVCQEFVKKLCADVTVPTGTGCAEWRVEAAEQQRGKGQPVGTDNRQVPVQYGRHQQSLRRRHQERT